VIVHSGGPAWASVPKPPGKHYFGAGSHSTTDVNGLSVLYRRKVEIMFKLSYEQAENLARLMKEHDL
jgi:hypothetical protein